MSYPSARSRLEATYFRLLTWISPKHLSHGLPVWTPLSTRAERSLIYERLNEALKILREYAPARYERVLRSLNGVLFWGTDAIRASYDPANGVCRLAESFTLAPGKTATAIACTIVHEATHAWLFKRGIQYDEPIRHRVELVCIRASLLAARRLPDAEAEVERCRGQLSIEPEHFSNEKFTQRSVDHLRQLGCPEWVIRAVPWLRRKRFAQ
jgi:hypothetical protein